jgi:hypothetical protein
MIGCFFRLSCMDQKIIWATNLDRKINSGYRNFSWKGRRLSQRCHIESLKGRTEFFFWHNSWIEKNFRAMPYLALQPTRRDSIFIFPSFRRHQEKKPSLHSSRRDRLLWQLRWTEYKKILKMIFFYKCVVLRLNWWSFKFYVISLSFDSPSKIIKFSYNL